MQYREIHPAQPLARFVECFWTLEGPAAANSSPAERILPDGCAELILNFGSPFVEHQAGGARRSQPLQFLVGQLTQPLLLSPTGDVSVLGIRFHPGGTRPFFRLPMQELTNCAIELDVLDRRLSRELSERSTEASSLDQKIKVVQNALLDRLSNVRHGAESIVHIAASIIHHNGQVSVDRLSELAGMSRRHLERSFLREVGIGPKLLCRILRFQQVFRAVEQNNTGWASIAADCGYYDQAHLIRDFQNFALQTPTALFSDPNRLTDFFTRKHRSHFSNTHR